MGTEDQGQEIATWVRIQTPLALLKGETGGGRRKAGGTSMRRVIGPFGSEVKPTVLHERHSTRPLRLISMIYCSGGFVPSNPFLILYIVLIAVIR